MIIIHVILIKLRGMGAHINRLRSFSDFAPRMSMTGEVAAARFSAPIGTRMLCGLRAALGDRVLRGARGEGAGGGAGGKRPTKTGFATLDRGGGMHSSLI